MGIGDGRDGSGGGNGKGGERGGGNGKGGERGGGNGKGDGADGRVGGGGDACCTSARKGTAGGMDGCVCCANGRVVDVTRASLSTD